MFTAEERNFIEHDPGFIDLLRSFGYRELFMFSKLVMYICDLSQEEQQLLTSRIRAALTEIQKNPQNKE